MNQCPIPCKFIKLPTSPILEIIAQKSSTNPKGKKITKKAIYYPACDRICQIGVVGCNKCCDFLIKKKRPISGASAQRCYRWGGYILVHSIKYRFKSQIVINNPPTMPLHRMRTSAGFFLESTMQTLLS